ncbi:FCD domain-containing protein [Azospirillum brasilense]|nr:FCD domain-containing protein [Azospirillum brasilense]NUB32920.1 FCD domain-containing protein [Azospirillum brasilense]RIW02352.1 GntR family transcriptional regulator [Azospirillum brasilense]
MHDDTLPRSGPGVKPPAPPKPTLMEDAYHQLEEMIVTLEIAPGSVVSEAILSRSLNIGTTPIREALQRLAREHLVQILPRRGVIVTEVDVQQQFQVLEVRRELDRLIMRSAARRANAAERQAFADMAEGMRKAVETDDVREFLRLDGAFNQRAAAAARNLIAAETVAALHAISRRFWFFHHRDLADMPRTAELHIQVMRAIAAGDDNAAAEGAERLIDQLADLAKSTLLLG